MSKESDMFLSFLRKKNLKLTNQRQAILRTFLKTDKHLSVEDLYGLVRKEDSHIGQATVFRTLRLLHEAGIADEVDFGDKKIRYEHKYEHRHHDHLVCIECGKFIEVFDSNVEKMQKDLCKRTGFSPQRYKMKIFGTCRECRLRKKGRK